MVFQGAILQKKSDPNGSLSAKTQQPLRSSSPRRRSPTLLKSKSRIRIKPSGHLFLWTDKFHDCEGVFQCFTNSNLLCVDKITWNTNRLGMGFRSRQTAEYLRVFQKPPKRVKGCWTDHAISDVWTEKVKKNHPHTKPVELQRRLILATTLPGDIVLDPAAGGYSVLEACKLANRDFLGGDIKYG